MSCKAGPSSSTLWSVAALAPCISPKFLFLGLFLLRLNQKEQGEGKANKRFLAFLIISCLSLSCYFVKILQVSLTLPPSPPPPPPPLPCLSLLHSLSISLTLVLSRAPFHRAAICGRISIVLSIAPSLPLPDSASGPTAAGQLVALGGNARK